MNMRKILLAALVIAGTLTSCQEIRKHVPGRQPQMHNADSLIDAAYEARDYERIIQQVNELRSTQRISPVKAYYWKGYAYSRMRQMRLAELEWNHAVSQSIRTEEDLKYYAMASNRLAGLLFLKFDHEASIRVSMQALELMDKWGYNRNPDYANLLSFLGNCQLRLGQHEKARENYSRAYEIYEAEEGGDIQNLVTSVMGLVAINEAHLVEQDYLDAYSWTERLETLLQRYQAHPDAQPSFVDKQTARLFFYRACSLEGLGDHRGARKLYEKASETAYGKSSDGKIEASRYLIQAGRWSDAADKLNILEEQSTRYDLRPNLENIQYLMLPKLRSNILAHRTDSAMAIGLRLCAVLDSAIVLEKKDAALELATIYETQQKEAQLAQKNTEIAQERFMTTIFALSFVLFLAILIIFFRRQSALRLEKAFVSLESANARAEESARMKDKFIQQISHEIRTPLNIITGFSQVLTMPEVDLDDSTREEVKKQMTENTDRITGLVNKMIELSEAGSRTVIERTEQVTPMQIAAWGIDGSGISISKHVKLDLQISPSAEAAVLLTNKKAAVRALILVMDNARKFTAPPGYRNDKSPEKKQRVSLHIDTTEDNVVFTVEDTGIGIPPEKADVIFNEFVQLDDYYDGVGIGLAVARSLARRLGGNLTLDTSYTGGARFVYTLPLS